MNIQSKKIRFSAPPALPTSQQGAVLIVSLILLLVMTLIGVSNMRSSSLQLNMAANTQARNDAFHAAEFTLAAIENDIQVNLDFSPGDNLWNCNAGAEYCFTEDCSGGMCFEGDYPEDAMNKIQCDMENLDENNIPEVIWLREISADTKVWDDDSKHVTFEVQNSDIEPKYIVEFLCYVSTDPGNEDCSEAAQGFCAPFFRITVLAESDQGNAKVMLQATTRIAP